MPSQYSSPFDDLLNIGRRQLDELAGKRAGEVGPSASSSPVVNLPALHAEPEAHPGVVVEGTAAGIPFKLKTK